MHTIPQYFQGAIGMPKAPEHGLDCICSVFDATAINPKGKYFPLPCGFDIPTASTPREKFFHYAGLSASLKSSKRGISLKGKRFHNGNRVWNPPC
jgi:hypothetical protein